MPLPYVPFPNCVEAVLQGISSATAAFITMGFQFGGSIAPSDMSTLAARLEAWYHANVQPNICPSCDFESIKLTDLTTAFSPVINHSFATPGIGAATPPEVPNNCCMVVSFGTLNRGRSYRGRNYIPALPIASQVTGTLWSAAVAAVWTAAYQALPPLIASYGWEHVVLSRFNGGSRRTVGVATRVTSYQAKEPIGTQRRRVIGHGI